MKSTNIAGSRSHTPFRAWDPFDRLFDEAFSRSKTRSPSPEIQSPLPPPYPEPHPYASPPPGFRCSRESLGLSGPEDQDIDDPFDKIWNEGLRRTRRSTVTKSKTLKRAKRVLDGSGSNSPSTSNDASSSAPSANPPPPPPTPPLETVKSPRMKKRKSKYASSCGR